MSSGKNAMKAASATFDQMPNPSPATRIGAKATFGAALTATRNGITTSRPNAVSATRTPSRIPKTAASRNPIRTSFAVIQRFSAT